MNARAGGDGGCDMPTAQDAVRLHHEAEDGGAQAEAAGHELHRALAAMRLGEDDHAFGDQQAAEQAGLQRRPVRGATTTPAMKPSTKPTAAHTHATTAAPIQAPTSPKSSAPRAAPVRPSSNW